jgi:uncharacterized protein with HEPN domain
MKPKLQSMDNKMNKVLKDILICIENIDSYLGKGRIFAEYDSNPLLQDAIERNLITIGEAMNNLLKIAPNINITNARKVVDARNRLTHGYDEIENVQVWNIIIKYLPILKSEVKLLLNE